MSYLWKLFEIEDDDFWFFVKFNCVMCGIGVFWKSSGVGEMLWCVGGLWSGLCWYCLWWLESVVNYVGIGCMWCGSWVFYVVEKL